MNSVQSTLEIKILIGTNFVKIHYLFKFHSEIYHSKKLSVFLVHFKDILPLTFIVIWSWCLAHQYYCKLIDILQ